MSTGARRPADDGRPSWSQQTKSKKSKAVADAYYQTGVQRRLKRSEHWTVKDGEAISGESK
jgi:hypothetical protein